MKPDPELHPDGLAWLSETVAALQRCAVTDGRAAFERRFRTEFARVPRKVRADAGDEAVHAEARAAARRRMLCAVLDEIARDDAQSLLGAVWRGAGLDEQIDLLRALPDLPQREAFVDLAISACRTNARDVLGAIALANPYPAACFPDAAFAQMVVKSMFLELDVAAIEGLRDRISPQLLQMVGDYAQERIAAGRPVPPGVALIRKLAEERHDEVL